MIRVEGLHKWFGSHHVLCGTNLVIEEGETLVIIGQSGCGKSVLLKHMIGILEPDEGCVFVEGADLAHLGGRELGAVRSRIGMVFQGAALFDSLTVRQNVGFSLDEHTSLPEETVRGRVAEKLSLVGLRGIEEAMPSSLSGGMKKRVGLARAICNDPKIILYDEPTTGLDPINADVINDLILRMQQKLKVTSVVVTHDMTSAYKVADRIAMLHHGRIIQVGTVDEIQNTDNPVVKQFISGSASGPITGNGEAREGREGGLAAGNREEADEG